MTEQICYYLLCFNPFSFGSGNEYSYFHFKQGQRVVHTKFIKYVRSALLLLPKLQYYVKKSHFGIHMELIYVVEVEIEKNCNDNQHSLVPYQILFSYVLGKQNF